MSLDSRWHVLVRDTTSKNPDKWVTLSELDSYLNEDETSRIIRVEEMVFAADEPDGSSLEERMDALDDTETGAVPVLMERADAVDQQLFETQGMADKLAAFELRKDSVVEILENKSIVNPQINETPVRAYFDIALSAPATKKIRISAITPGVAANSYTYEVVATTVPNYIDILWNAPDLVVSVLKDSVDNIITTAYELARLAAVTPDFVSNFIISFDDGTLITEDGDGAGVIAKADSGSFANGAGADHVLTSTGTEIDAAVNMYLSNKYDATAAPGATNDIDEGYVVGSKWFDTVSKEWYICTANTQDNATWANTTLEAGELGTAAVADIVNDLTTGGTTDALSAEQGKELKTMLNTEAGYIDALQAVAPEYTATFATATAASNVLTIEDEPAEGATVTVGAVTYRFRRDALTEDGVNAHETINFSGLPTAGDTVTIGSGATEKVYKFVAACADANDVLIGADAEACVDNLVAAITDNGTEGTQYGTGTTAHTLVTAVKHTATSLVVERWSSETMGNDIVIAENATNVDLTGGTGYLTGGIYEAEPNDVYTGGSKANAITHLIHAITFDGGDGTNEGTQYWSVEAANSLATAEASGSDDIVVTALVKGAAGNLIAAEVDGDSDISWSVAGDVLSGGVDGTVGATGKVIFTASTAYFCTDGTKCTISDSTGWKTAEFS